jgi:hypothetical protein
MCVSPSLLLALDMIETRDRCHYNQYDLRSIHKEKKIHQKLAHAELR